MDRPEPTDGPAEPEPGSPPSDADPTPDPIVDGQDHAVDPRSVRLARIVGIPITLGVALALWTPLSIAWIAGGLPTVGYATASGIVLSIAAAVATIAYRYPAARYRHLRYRVDTDGLRIERGVFWRKTTWIPMTRVQHTDVSQGPLERRYGLATLTLHTAGTENATIELAGLEHDLATRLSEHLRPRRTLDGE